MHTRTLVAGLLSGLLAAGCGSGSTSTPQADNSSSSSSGSSSGSGPTSGNIPPDNASFQVGCDWFPAFDSQDHNVAFPETSATYWIAVGPSSPGADMQLQISGNYLDARYFSLHVYDGTGAAKDHLPDYLIQPDSGSQSTFSAVTRRSGAGSGGAYTAYLNFRAAPAVPAPNTLYRGTDLITTITGQKRSYLMLRVYVPGNGTASDGGYQLPQLVLHSASGDVPLSRTPDAANCQALYDGFIQSSSAQHQTLVPSPPQNPPQFKAYGGDVLSKGYFRNQDIAYIYATTTLKDGPIQLIRGQAPGFTDQAGGAAAPQLRYWSICQNDYDTQQVSACITDRDAVLDAAGYYTVVIADPAQRPANADAADGFNFLPYGPTADTGAVILRNMLPNAGFDQAAQNVPSGGDPARVMGAYSPQASYCSRAVFEAARGQSPAAVFAACKTASALLP